MRSLRLSEHLDPAVSRLYSKIGFDPASAPACWQCEDKAVFAYDGGFVFDPATGKADLYLRGLGYSVACGCRAGQRALAKWHAVSCRACDYGILRLAYAGPASLGMHFCPACQEGQRLEQSKARLAASRAQAGLNGRLKESGLLADLQDKTFDNFSTWGQTPADQVERARARQAVMRAAEARQSLLLIGMFGIGKSHLAAAYLNYWLGQGQPGVFKTFIGLYDHVKDAIDNADGGGSWAERVQLLCSVPILVIDDLDKAKFTARSVEVLFRVLDERLAAGAGLATIVTLNNTLPELWRKLERVADVDGFQVGALRSRLAGPAFVRVGWNCADWRMQPGPATIDMPDPWTDGE